MSTLDRLEALEKEATPPSGNRADNYSTQHSGHMLAVARYNEALKNAAPALIAVARAAENLIDASTRFNPELWQGRKEELETALARLHSEAPGDAA